MFLFKCCQAVESNSGFQVTKHSQNKEQSVTFVGSLDDIPASERASSQVQVITYERCEYESLVDQYKGTEKRWTDPFFPPDENSLGYIPGVTSSQWKRISDMLNKPALFEGKIQPRDVLQTGQGDCYFLSALAALAQDQRTIKRVFGKQGYNPNSIYKVALRVDGKVQQILVDDFVPVDARGLPLFCQPNKNQFWTLIIEKAWAKAHGSYANIIAGNPSQVFKAVTYAPAQITAIKQSPQQYERMWRVLLTHCNNRRPSCCITDGKQSVDWDQIGLLPGYVYTLIDVAEVKHNNGKIYQMLVLRNPGGRLQWEGDGCENDREFWNNIIPSTAKTRLLGHANQAKDGIFFMTFNDFCRYFSQVHSSLNQPQASYICEDLHPNGKNGSLFTFKAAKQGTYSVQLHQSSVLYNEQSSTPQAELCRSTLLLAKLNNKTYDFVDGVLKYYDEDTTLVAKLQPGEYIIYAKLDRCRVTGKLPDKSNLSVYSTELVQLQVADRKAHEGILQRVFTEHAKQNKKQTYNNDLMWISWKLMFQQGGFAYVAFGNSQDSNKKFVVTFDQDAFISADFKLKKGFKGKGNGQVLVVYPGQEAIILARAKNTHVKGLKFPPPLDIKLEKVREDSQQ